MRDTRVANRVQQTRLEKRLTQQQLAQAAGLSRQSIISIEKGRFIPSVETALLLARALEVSLPEIFWLKETSS